VWAHATSNVPWLEISRPKFDGRRATVAMPIASVPDRPGETLTGELTVIGKGDVRWAIPLSLTRGDPATPSGGVAAMPERAPPAPAGSKRSAGAQRGAAPATADGDPGDPRRPAAPAAASPAAGHAKAQAGGVADHAPDPRRAAGAGGTGGGRPGSGGRQAEQ